MQFLSGRITIATRVAALAMVVLLGSVAGFSTARAQDGDTLVVEKHLALIIANQDYVGDGGLNTGPADRPPQGFLKNLPTPAETPRSFSRHCLMPNGNLRTSHLSLVIKQQPKCGSCSPIFVRRCHIAQTRSRSFILVGMEHNSATPIQIIVFFSASVRS